MHRIDPPVHPGEYLREEYLLLLQLTPQALAEALTLPRTYIERLVREETPIVADSALRLGRYFGTSPEFWMNLQTAYDLAVAATAIGSALEDIEPPYVSTEEDLQWLNDRPRGRELI